MAFKLYFMNKVTVNYRQHKNAINNTGNLYIVNPNYFNDEAFRKVYTYPFLPLDIMLDQKFQFYILQIFRHKKINIKNKLTIAIYNFLTIYINPFKYLIKFHTFLKTNLRNDEFYQ